MRAGADRVGESVLHRFVRPFRIARDRARDADEMRVARAVELFELGQPTIQQQAHLLS